MVTFTGPVAIFIPELPGDTVARSDGGPRKHRLIAPSIGCRGAGGDLRQASERVVATAKAIDALIPHGLPRQIGQDLFRYAAAGQTQHLMSARRVLPAAAQAYDARLREAWEIVLDVHLTDAMPLPSTT